jgi:DNA invertase Pin-like site-specific DNA recombinase
MADALIYCRISKDDAGDRLGVERQEKFCRELAARRGLTVVDALVDDDISAFRSKIRPGFEKLVEALKGGEASAVVAYHVDRLYRRLADLDRLVDVVEVTGAAVHTVAAGDIDLSTASGRMIARMLGAAAQHESERIGERVKAKNSEHVAKGNAPGGRAPYGFQWLTSRTPEGGTVSLKRYVHAPDEAAAVRRMADRVLEGASTLAIAREMTAAGIPTREGKPWHHATVRAVLINPAVAGLRVHRREVAGPGDWEAILDRGTWEEVRAVLADPARKRTRPPRRYLLAGLVENPTGERMNGVDAHNRVSYATRWPAEVPLSIDAAKLETFVTEAVLVALDAAIIPTVAQMPGAGGEVVALEAELAELATLRGNGTISLAEWMAAREPLQVRLETAKRDAGTVKRPGPNAGLLGKPGAARKVWPKLDLMARREIIATVVDRIVVSRASRGRWTPLDERLDIVWRV